MVDGVSYHSGGCKCREFPQMVDGVSYHVGGCKCWAFLTWMLDVFLPWSDVSVGRAFVTWMLDVFLPWSDISAEEDEDLHGG